MIKNRNVANDMALDIASSAMLAGILPGTKKFKKLVKEKSDRNPEVDPTSVAEIAAQMISFARSELESDLFSRFDGILEELERRECLTSNQVDVINDALNDWIVRGEVLGGEITYTRRRSQPEGWNSGINSGESRMSALVLPFPGVRRRSFVLRHAQHIASLSIEAGEKHLARQLKIQVDAMTRKGVAPDLIEQESRILGSAIRAELWRLVLTLGGAA